MKKILFFFLFLIGIKAHAQYSSFDFIHVCGNPEKGKFLPMEQDSFRKAFSGNNLIEGFEHHLTFQLDSFCNGGVAFDLVSWLKKYPLVQIQLGVHSDLRGASALNKTNSVAKSQSLKTALTEAGIEASRIIPIGFGEDLPLVPEQKILLVKNKTEQEQLYRSNERIEIKILLTDYKYWFGLSDASFYYGQVLDPRMSAEFNRQYNHLYIPSDQPELKTAPGHNQCLDTAYRILNVLALFLQMHPELKLEIGVHSDLQGDEQKTTAITQIRANTLKEKLVGRGAKANQIIATGYGNQLPVISKAALSKLPPEEKKQAALKNRRVVFTIH
jgi:outer membrane protein OmpA-like peptidoglycan-associated protein